MRDSAGLEQHVWDVDLYGELLEIGGGKERMTKYFKVRPCRGQRKHEQLLIADLMQIAREHMPWRPSSIVM